jgi:hypothetical protein
VSRAIRIWLCVLALGTALCAGPVARAANVESLLMPGKVATAHAKYENECTNCHDRTNRSQQTALCVACHKDIGADQKAGKGFHGRMSNAVTGKCVGCHTEHLGRDGDIVRLSTTSFDHDRTDFALKGAHRTLTCASCHKSGEAHRKAEPTCIACHKKDDYHAGELGTACADCHNSDSWATSRFNHNEKTKFPLNGAHEQVSCGGCHLGGHYKQAPKTCVGCHATDDAHKGERGDDCGKCHTTSDWKTAKFDHEKEAKWALNGRHSKVDCLGCHRSGNYKDKIAKDCIGCHKADDSHAGRFGEKCDSCHNNDGWPGLKYDHLAKAKFALVEVHAKLECHACHTGVQAKQKLGTECASCHRAASPHGAKFAGACDTCHAQKSWREGISFDHDLTRWPLLGLHSVVSCAQCHRTQAFLAAGERCVDCHKADDIHKGGLGDKCDTCHSPNGWQLWQYDHFKQTGFALSGAHGKNACADCHRKPAGEVKLSPDCVSCHQKDDIHAGQFGRQCQRCHTTVTFQGGRAR